jgi:hypothetical protein
VFPQFRSEADFLDMDYHQMKAFLAFAHRYRAAQLGG